MHSNIMKILNPRFNNNANIAKDLFENIIIWAAQKRPMLTESQVIKNIEKILDEIEKKGYNKNKQNEP